MIILRSVDQLKEYVGKVFATVFEESKANEISTYIVTGLGDRDIVNGYAKASKQKTYDDNMFGEVSQAIFQLENYRDVLKKYIEFLLLAEQFESVCSFVNKLFVTNVGTFRYKSVQRAYSLSERYFDRFVEIEKFCDIDDELVMPYFVTIIKSDARSLCYNFKEPLKEYLKVYMQTAHEKLYDYVIANKVFDCLEYLLEADTNKTLRHIIEGYVQESFEGVPNLKNYLTKYKQEAFNILEPYARNSDEQVAYRAISLLMLFKGEWGIDNFLDSIYETTNSSKLKGLISRELEIDKFVPFETLDDYKKTVLEQTETIQERLYGLRLKKYYEKYNLLDEFEAKSATFMMETFKVLSNEMLIKYMKGYFGYADNNTKEVIANIVFDMATRRDKLNGSKWALRLIACFGSKELIAEMIEIVRYWLTYLKNSDAEYFVKCMAIYARKEFIDVVKALHLDKSIPDKKLKKIDKLLEIYSDCSNISYDNVEYMLIEDFGLNAEGYRVFDLGRRKVRITLDADLQVVVTNDVTGKVGRLADDVVCGDINLKKYVKAVEKQVAKQSKKLKELFLSNITLTYDDFSNLILSNNLLKIVAGKVLWGKYKNNRLYESFRVVDGSIRHVSGTYLTDSDYAIAICHPLDIQDNLRQIKASCGELLFNQLDFACFTRNYLGNNTVLVDKFNGMFVNANLFITRLEKLTYKINDLGKDLYYNTLVKANHRLDILTVVEFDRVKLNEEKNYTTTISSIRFYKLSTLPKDGKNYCLAKGEPIPLIAIDERVLSNELALIYKAAENK